MDQLLEMEKQTRFARDLAGSKAAVTGILTFCFEAKDWKSLNEQIHKLSKKGGQLIETIVAMIQRGLIYVDETPDIETRVELIKTLVSVCTGKVCFEIERARLVRRLVKIKEEQGLVTEAANLIMEVAVETFVSMQNREKTDFILEQVRLCLDCEDYVRAHLISSMINPRALDPQEGDNGSCSHKNIYSEELTQKAHPGN
ncbi:hypothetical protein V6N13_106571 [Hibiscus sabdariffa]